ncbi:MAG TPA: aldo/keto reductase [Dehalococcoidia bacterium]|nr:aldo/keto reductase [Dehalococcoidia bacterium]
MEYRKVGRTGLKVSQFCLGTMTFGDQVSESDAIAMIHAAMDAGLNFIDTADMYVKGRSEEIVGKALQGRRDQVVLATKFGNPMGPFPNDRGASRKYVMHAIEASLRRLNTDYVDLYYLHLPDYTTPIEETLRALDDLVHQGKVRYPAVSNFRAFQISKALWTSDVNGLARFECVQPPYNLLTRDIEYELLPLCAEEGLGVCVYNPLAGGLLTGKHDPSKPPAPGTRFSNETMGRMYYERYWNETNFRAVEHFRAIAAQAGHDMVQMALAWILGSPNITSVIIGATSPKHIEKNMGAAEITLTDEERAACDEIWKELRPLRFFYGR